MRAVLRLLSEWTGGRSTLWIAAAIFIMVLILGIMASCAVQEVRDNEAKKVTDEIIYGLVCRNPKFSYLCEVQH